MAKCCGTCLYWPDTEVMVDGSRRCTWFAVTQLGRKLKECGPSWARPFTSMPTYKSNGADCPAYEPSE